MLRALLSILFVAIMSTPTRASEESTVLLKKAREARAAGQDEAARQQAVAAIKQDPNDLEARWFIIAVQLGGLTNLELPDRAIPLATLSPAFNELTDMTRKAKQNAFLSYITATYATYYKNYERAVIEIDKALALEPNSTRYLAAKGRIWARFGEWIKDDKRIETGIRYLRQASDQANKGTDPDNEPSGYDFALASALADLSQPRWQEVMQHYERYLQNTKHETRSYAFAWNNVSIAYRHLGECQKAKDAAEAALKVRAFGAAENNRNRAEFCLEMQKLGMATNLGKTKR
jgi:tetratricopeptide (TPR) repeat protein